MIKVTSTTLQSVANDYDEFSRFFREYAFRFSVDNARLVPVVSAARLFDAHSFWKADLKRLTFSLHTDSVTPDHFKQAAHLAYWLRRSGPVIEFFDSRGPMEPVIDKPLEDKYERIRELLFNYGTEYFAFDLGYLICRFYETNRSDGKHMSKDFTLDEEYIQTVCCFLKEKNVSPHALYLLYKSLFYKRG